MTVRAALLSRAGRPWTQKRIGEELGLKQNSVSEIIGKADSQQNRYPDPALIDEQTEGEAAAPYDDEILSATGRAISEAPQSVLPFLLHWTTYPPVRRATGPLRHVSEQSRRISSRCFVMSRSLVRPVKSRPRRRGMMAGRKMAPRMNNTGPSDGRRRGNLAAHRGAL